MQFKKDAAIFTAMGDKIGHIERVVLDPQTKELTHVVVREGWFFTEDKVIPVEMIASTTEDEVILHPDIGKLEELPDFEEAHFVSVNEEELARGSTNAVPYVPSLYWYPPPLPMDDYAGLGYSGYVDPGYVIETEQNIPEGTVALKEGAKVIAADDDVVGSIDELVTDSRTGRVTHIVISQGLFLKEKKVAPSTWIRAVTETEVHLAVGSRTVDNLQPYEA